MNANIHIAHIMAWKTYYDQLFCISQATTCPPVQIFFAKNEIDIFLYTTHDKCKKKIKWWDLNYWFWAMPYLRWLSSSHSPWKPWTHPRPRFMMDEVGLWQVFLHVLQFWLSVPCYQCYILIHSYHGCYKILAPDKSLYNTLEMFKDSNTQITNMSIQH